MRYKNEVAGMMERSGAALMRGGGRNGDGKSGGKDEMVRRELAGEQVDFWNFRERLGRRVSEVEVQSCMCQTNTKMHR